MKRHAGGLLRLWYIRISIQNVSQHTLETLTNEREISCVGVTRPFDKTAKMICWWPSWVEPTRHRWMGLMWSAYREQKIATNVWNVLGQFTNENIYFLLHSYWKQFSFNILRPRQNRRHFADDILKCIFVNENVWIPIAISLKFDPKGPIDNIPALV